MKGKPGIFIFIIILLLVAAVFYWGWVSPSIAPLEKDNGGVMASVGGKDSVFVEDQASAMSVRIAKLTLSQDGWVVIHDEREIKPGLIIAAARFDAGTYENRDVDLLGQTTEEGKTYFAMLHRDDGDRQFDYTKDLPITDSSGNVVMMKFMATGSGDQNTANWQTYRNEEYGIEFKYPPKIAIEIAAVDSLSLWLVNDGDYADKDMFSAYPITPYENLTEFRKNRNTPTLAVTLGDYVWYRFEIESTANYVRYVLEKDDNGYVFTMYALKNETRLKQILSTFKFIQ